MSRANGYVFDGQRPWPVGCCIYNGTVDIMHSNVFRTSDEAWEDWNVYYENIDKQQGVKKCKCEDDSPCWLMTDYGSGTFWQARWCPKCGVITQGCELP